jgi:hypothetical protein
MPGERKPSLLSGRFHFQINREDTALRFFTLFFTFPTCQGCSTHGPPSQNQAGLGKKSGSRTEKAVD